MSDGGKLANPEPPPPVGDARGILRRAQWLWTACLFLPFVYLGLAWIVESVWFARNEGFGFWPLRAAHYRILLGALAACAVGSQAAILVLHRRYAGRIRDARLRPALAATLLLRRTFYMAAWTDLVSGLGLVAFLFNADWNALIAFCACSFLLYAQIHPHAAGIE